MEPISIGIVMALAYQLNRWLNEWQEEKKTTQFRFVNFSKTSNHKKANRICRKNKLR